MKNRCFRPLLAMAILAALAGCPASVGTGQFAVELSDFPETGVTFSVILQSFDTEGNYLESADLGPAGLGQLIVWARRSLEHAVSLSLTTAARRHSSLCFAFQPPKASLTAMIASCWILPDGRSG